MRHPTLSRRWFVHRVRTRHSRFVYERPLAFVDEITPELRCWRL